MPTGPVRRGHPEARDEIAGACTTASPPGVSNYPDLAAASSVSASFCVAVGLDAGDNGFARLSESSDGSDWTVETS